MENKIQESMFYDFRKKEVFKLSHLYNMQYLENFNKRNIFPDEKALSDLAQFDEDFPQKSSNSIDVLNLLQQYGAPSTVSQLGGRYFGFVTGSSIPIGLAAKSLATFWDQNSALFTTSPIASKLESVVEKWLLEIFNLDSHSAVSFLSGSSMATFCGLAAGRMKILKDLNWDINKSGYNNAPKLRIVMGKHTHATVIRAIKLLGLGTDCIEWIDADSEGRIKIEKIPKLNSKTILILQAGNVNSGSFDDFDKICKTAKNQGAWIHIDGAFGLWAAASSKLKQLTNGMELADSFSVDGHKTLNTPYDCGILICKNRKALESAFELNGAYINPSQNRDSMNTTPQMSRRARIIELWAILKFLGKEGISQLVENMHEQATYFCKKLNSIDGFHILNDVVFNQILLSCDNDLLTEKTLELVQKSGTCWAGSSLWFGKKVIRISVSSWATTNEDINKSFFTFVESLKIAQKRI